MKRTTLACLFLLLAAPLAAQRLPQTVLPEHYALRFAPDFTKDNFQGEAVITVRVTEATGSVTLHAAEIEFQQVTITAGGQTQTARVELKPDSETATFTVDRALPPGPATIQITFVGQLNDKLRGFYLSKANGRKYAVTQLEATDARRAFPCFDEPAMKATFDVTLTIDAGDTAISNGRILQDTPGPGANKHTLKFSTTPKMATYLVAMIVGDFVCREGASLDGIPIRICSTPDKKALTGFALEAAQQEISFYNRYYGIKYPFGKLDVVAVPDFAAGAMENTAAITFREVLLLADPNTATLNAKKNIAAVMSHEIAHMWFGDLVTMKWWDDIWLNEGFATWAANKPLQEWKPEWRTELDDAVASQTALNVDTLQSTRPIRAKMETPDQISEAFDAIAYQKGSAVLLMVEAYVGEDIFRKGVTAYLKKYSYTNASSENFWTEISRASGKPVNEIMASFVEQPGVPLISVESKCEGATTAVSLTQRRFFFNPALMSGGATPAWRIPVCMKTAGAATPKCEVLTAPRQTFKLPGCSAWVFANAGAKGYYRTEYTPGAVDALASKISALSASERISLAEDEWALVRTGRHAIGQYLGLTEALAPDPTSTIIQTVARRLAYIGDYLATDQTRESYHAWTRKTFGPALRKIGWEPAAKELETTRSLRATLMVLLGVTGRDPDVLQRSRTLAEQYLKNPDSVDPTLSVAALAIAAKTGDPALYDQFVAKIRSASGVQEYYRFLNTLTEFTDPALVDRTLEYALSGDVKSQDAPGLIAGLLSEPDAQRQVWAFVKARWATLDQMLGTFQGIPTVVGATAAFCEASARDDVRQFFEANKVPAAERALRQSLESINNCASLRDRQQANLANWLTRASGSSGRP